MNQFGNKKYGNKSKKPLKMCLLSILYQNDVNTEKITQIVRFVPNEIYGQNHFSVRKVCKCQTN